MACAGHPPFCPWCLQQFARARAVNFAHHVCNSLMNGAVAAHFVCLTSAEGADHATKFAITSVLGLVHGISRGLCWTHDLREDTVPLLLSFSVAAFLLSIPAKRAIQLTICLQHDLTLC